MEAKHEILSPVEFFKQQQLLDYLKNKKRLDIAEQIRIARGFGDLSENAEYSAAKDEQSNNEYNIVVLEDKLHHAEVPITAAAKAEVDAANKNLKAGMAPADAFKGAAESRVTGLVEEIVKALADGESIDSITTLLDDISAHVVEIAGSEDTVAIGDTVKAKLNNKTYTFTIVGSAECDPSVGKISNDSPIGHALLGLKVKDKVHVETPGGLAVLQVVSIIR